MGCYCGRDCDGLFSPYLGHAADHRLVLGEEREDVRRAQLQLLVRRPQQSGDHVDAGARQEETNVLASSKRRSQGNQRKATIETQGIQ